MTLKLVGPEHEEFFDTEDEAFAFIVGLKTGHEGEPSEVDVTTSEDIAEAYSYGIELGRKHKNIRNVEYHFDHHCHTVTFHGDHE